MPFVNDVETVYLKSLPASLSVIWLNSLEFIKKKIVLRDLMVLF